MTRVLLGIFAVTLTLQFYRLGMGELVPWDESLYTVRAKACLQFGAWLDQTDYAVGGLYSSSHPPLGIWLMAFSVSILGESEFTYRFISALSAVIALVFCFKICKRYVSDQAALAAAILLGNAQIFLYYGHHAQLDILRDAFVITALYFSSKAFDDDSLRNTLIAGLLLGCALLTKAFQALYCVPFLFTFAYLYHSTKVWKRLKQLSITAVIVILPWYVYMVVNHPEYFDGLSSLLTKLSGGTYAETSNTKWWYYFNQLVVQLPLLLVVAVVGWRGRRTTFFTASFVWFITMMLIVTVMQTKMPHFILFLLLPGVLMFAGFTEKFISDTNPKSIWISIALPALPILWSSSELLRMSIRTNTITDFLAGTTLFQYQLMVFSFAALVFAAFRARGVVIVVSLSIILVMNIYRVTIRKESVYLHGARQISSIVDSIKPVSLVTLAPRVSYDTLMPQFAHYSNGMNLGWRKNTRTSPLSWQTFTQTRTQLSEFQAALVYTPWDNFYVPTAEDIREKIVIDSILRTQFRITRRAGRYVLYY